MALRLIITRVETWILSRRRRMRRPVSSPEPRARAAIRAGRSAQLAYEVRSTQPHRMNMRVHRMNGPSPRGRGATGAATDMGGRTCQRASLYAPCAPAKPPIPPHDLHPSCRTPLGEISRPRDSQALITAPGHACVDIVGRVRAGYGPATPGTHGQAGSIALVAAPRFDCPKVTPRWGRRNAPLRTQAELAAFGKITLARRSFFSLP